MKDVKVAAVAFRSEFGDPAANCESMLALVTEAAGAGADWVTFPEVALQGYHSDVARMQREAEPLDGVHLGRLRRAAAQHTVTLSVGLALRLDDGRVLNSVLHIGPDGEFRGEPRCSGKVHVCPGNEQELFATPRPEESFPVVDLGFAKVGTVICCAGTPLPTRTSVDQPRSPPPLSLQCIVAFAALFCSIASSSICSVVTF